MERPLGDFFCLFIICFVWLLLILMVFKVEKIYVVFFLVF